LISIVLNNQQSQAIHFRGLPAGKHAGAYDLQYAPPPDKPFDRRYLRGRGSHRAGPRLSSNFTT
jgi:hypothetical protein